MSDQVKSGVLRGTGAAINVSLGWIPDVVIVSNHTDGNSIHIGMPGRQIMPFTSGGTTQISAGDTITGATSGATAKVVDVILDTGSWAGGDAAGWFVLDVESESGTFGSENVYVGSGTNDATVTVDVTSTQVIDTAVASATGNAAITAYTGSTSAAKGFTLGFTISTDAKLLYFIAFRGADGADGFLCQNSA